MSCLFRSNSSVSSRSTRLAPMPNTDLVLNEEEHEYQNVKIDLGWNIPKVKTKEIYKTSFLQWTFNVDLQVKTVEQVFALSKPRETLKIQLKNISKLVIIHLWLIQVGINPLTQQGKNASVLLCLRDARFINYNASVMGMMESGLHKGPVHFNCFPDFTLSLRDPHILKA